jgi:ADP-ribose pyrophosphatase YjhB (NUDIX family)
VPAGPLSEDEFHAIYAKVPRLTVEVVVRSARGVYLTRRAAGPCRGLWHIPGGTVRFGEPLADAVARVARDELGIEVLESRLLGVIEYPSHYLGGLDSPVGLAYEVVARRGQPWHGADADASGWFAEPPEAMHDEQRDFLLGQATPA